MGLVVVLSQEIIKDALSIPFREQYADIAQLSLALAELLRNRTGSYRLKIKSNVSSRTVENLPLTIKSTTW